jgi:hypothetical protein
MKTFRSVSIAKNLAHNYQHLFDWGFLLILILFYSYRTISRIRQQTFMDKVAFIIFSSQNSLPCSGFRSKQKHFLHDFSEKAKQ